MPHPVHRFADFDAVSPETAKAVSTLMQCREGGLGQTGHGRRRAEANANLVPYIDRMAHAYNKTAKVQQFEAGQTVGLTIPTRYREKLDNKLIVCMVLPGEHKDKHAYKLRCEHGIVKGLVRTDELVLWRSPYTFSFTATEDVSMLSSLTIAAAARRCTQANDQPSQCGCKAGCRTQTCSCRKAGVQCTARCHNGIKCSNWGQH